MKLNPIFKLIFFLFILCLGTFLFSISSQALLPIDHCQRFISVNHSPDPATNSLRVEGEFEGPCSYVQRYTCTSVCGNECREEKPEKISDFEYKLDNGSWKDWVPSAWWRRAVGSYESDYGVGPWQLI